MSTLDRDQLLSTFAGYGSDKRLIGGEFERAVVRPDGTPVSYEEAHGIRWILEEFANRWGWEIVREGPNPIALLRDGANITLEPGGQFELSGAPHATLSALKEEMYENRRNLLELCTEAGWTAIAAGLTPVAAIEDIPWMPKGRYAIMREYLPNKGDLALFMMKGTSSVQANFDYRDEADCADKVELCTGLAPLITAIFANSPLYQNKPNGFMSMRGHIWTRTDPDRTGFPAVIASNYSHEAWVDYLLDVPMMFYTKGSSWLPAEGRSFRIFMEDGIDGQYPTMADWELHQTSVFPEVRVKRTIEVRCADCVGHELALSFCALFAGLLYCPAAQRDALAFVRELRKAAAPSEQFDAACRGGLGGTIGGRATGEWADELADLSVRGLRNCIPDDVWMLDALLERIRSRRSPAQDLLDAWHRDPRPEAVIHAVAY